ncbi:unnamed protein product [Periconia digitata]|uniref:Uncharacterized protein n=1 Tax=Periconia digitata TaxID=1303443 RepID=A0A9W4UEW5_9PLEO|nr:unnamed protein product [Periconia digitata]
MDDSLLSVRLASSSIIITPDTSISEGGSNFPTENEEDNFDAKKNSSLPVVLRTRLVQG